DNNDMKFGTPQGFGTGADFLTYLTDAFDTLYAEGAESPKMMSVGLHARLVGRPGRLAALARFLDHVERHDHVWICRRIDIATHWIATHPSRGCPRAPPPGASRVTLRERSGPARARLRLRRRPGCWPSGGRSGARSRAGAAPRPRSDRRGPSPRARPSRGA